MNKESFLSRVKNTVTEGHPDIFWKWVMECVAIIVVTLGIAHLGVSFLKYKGVL